MAELVGEASVAVDGGDAAADADLGIGITGYVEAGLPAVGIVAFAEAFLGEDAKKKQEDRRDRFHGAG